MSDFTLVGIRQTEPAVSAKKQKWQEGKPLFSIFVLSAILLGCICCELFIPKDPAYMDLQHYSTAPGRAFWFGTDTMGRDLFSMIWYGGRLSLFIGFASAMLSALVAIIFGSVSGLAPQWADALLMRFVETLLSVPNLLPVIFIQAALGDAGVLGISFAIGITGWAGMAKVVRTEVRRLRVSEYVIASKCMGGSFFHIVRRHLAPNFLSSILFMAVMNVRNGIVAESALSFMGIGLPVAVISWGSMLSLSQHALLSGAWWIILIPGVFLVTTLLCVTNIGNCWKTRD